MKSLDFTMRKIMDAKLAGLGTLVSGDIRLLDLSEFSGIGATEKSLHITAGNVLEGLDNGSAWVQGTLVKIPADILTKGDNGLVEKQGLYTIVIKTDKAEGEYLNEAISLKVEEYFGYNQHISEDGQILTINKTWQQPNIFVDSPSGRYWNRVFVDCEIYYVNN